MRMHVAVWVGSLALVLAAIITTAQAQTVPSAGANALDQAAPDSPSSLFPASGLTLDEPNGFEQPRDSDSNHLRPSDGLGLQIYDLLSTTPAGNDDDRGAQQNHNQ